MHTPDHTAGGDIHAGAAKAYSYNCDGTAWLNNPTDRISSWGAHVVPGVLALIWSLHWGIGTFRSYAKSPSSYQARSSYGIALMKNSRHAPSVEPWLRTLLPMLGLAYQLFIGPGGFATALCSADTPRHGRLIATHIYYWQNSWVLTLFVLAGVLGLLQQRLRLPSGTDQVALAIGFAFQALFLGTSTYPEAEEAQMYLLLYLVVGATAVCLLLEVLVPNQILVSCGKVYSLMLSAVWYFALARVLYEGRPAWQSLTAGGMDMAPVMFIGVMFVMWANVVGLTLFILFVSIKVYYDAIATSSSSDAADSTSSLQPNTQ